MTSKCTMSAPAATTASTSSPKRAKFADKIEGAIQGAVRDDMLFSETSIRQRQIIKHAFAQRSGVTPDVDERAQLVFQSRAPQSAHEARRRYSITAYHAPRESPHKPRGSAWSSLQRLSSS